MLRIQNRINKVKNIEVNAGIRTYLALENPVVLPTVACEPLEFLTNVSEIIKNIYGQTEIRTRTYCSKNFGPRLTAETIQK